jgi:5-methylcytosine-specific restriction endonuclease McrA
MTSWNKGKPWSKEMREKLSKSHIGIQMKEKHPMWKGGKPNCKNCGKKLSTRNLKTGLCFKCWSAIKKQSDETRKKISLANGGTGVPQRPAKRYYHLRDKKYFEWRTKVFERDNWTCQTCRKRGVYLEPHHIKGWAKYPKLRYEVENGVTLCKECHKLTRKKY